MSYPGHLMSSYALASFLLFLSTFHRGFSFTGCITFFEPTIKLPKVISGVNTLKIVFCEKKDRIFALADRTNWRVGWKRAYDSNEEDFAHSQLKMPTSVSVTKIWTRITAVINNGRFAICFSIPVTAEENIEIFAKLNTTIVVNKAQPPL
jgi:hypothetical protein